MKASNVAALIIISSVLGRDVSAQAFINLNFESANLAPESPIGNTPEQLTAAAAIPGWTPIGGYAAPAVNYNDVSLGATDVALVGKMDPFGPDSLDGRFSVWIYGGSQGPVDGASISQTGMVPIDAVSIRFIAGGELAPIGSEFGGPLLLSLGGQNIPFSVLSAGPNYTSYGGDVSAFAGQVEALKFSVPPGPNNIWELDDIQFSSDPVPEPSSFYFFTFTMGTIVFGKLTRASRRI